MHRIETLRKHRVRFSYSRRPARYPLATDGSRPRLPRERTAQAHPAAQEVLFRNVAQQTEMGRSLTLWSKGASSGFSACNQAAGLPDYGNHPQQNRISRPANPSAPSHSASPAAESAGSAFLPRKLRPDGVAHCSSTLAPFRMLPPPRSPQSRPPSLTRAANPAKGNPPSRKPAPQLPLSPLHRRSPSVPAQFS